MATRKPINTNAESTLNTLAIILLILGGLSIFAGLILSFDIGYGLPFLQGIFIMIACVISWASIKVIINISLRLNNIESLLEAQAHTTIPQTTPNAAYENSTAPYGNPTAPYADASTSYGNPTAPYADAAAETDSSTPAATEFEPEKTELQPGMIVQRLSDDKEYKVVEVKSNDNVLIYTGFLGGYKWLAPSDYIVVQ